MKQLTSNQTILENLENNETASNRDESSIPSKIPSNSSDKATGNKKGNFSK